MPPKLTLSIDQALIRRARREARTRGVSVSALVEQILATLPPAVEGEQMLTPTVRRLRGLLRDSGGDRESYRRHLVDKYLG